MSPPVRNMRVSWGASRKLRRSDQSGGDVIVGFAGQPLPSTIEHVTFETGSLDGINDDSRIFIDIRTLYSKKRFTAGTVGDITTPPVCVSSGSNSLDEVADARSLMSWKVIVVNSTGHLVAHMHDFVSHTIPLLDGPGDTSPLLRLGMQEIDDGMLFQVKYDDLGGPIVCIPLGQTELHDALRDRRTECWLTLNSIIDQIIEEIFGQHFATNTPNIDSHALGTWQKNWLDVLANSNFACPLPELNDDEGDALLLIDWKEKAKKAIAREINFNARYNEGDDE